MNVLTKSFGVDLLKASLGGGVVGLGYAAFYQLDKKITVPFFIISMIFMRTANQFVAVEKIQPTAEGEESNFRDVVGKELTQGEAAFRGILAAEEDFIRVKIKQHQMIMPPLQGS